MFANTRVCVFPIPDCERKKFREITHQTLTSINITDLIEKETWVTVNLVFWGDLVLCHIQKN